MREIYNKCKQFVFRKEVNAIEYSGDMLALIRLSCINTFIFSVVHAFFLLFMFKNLKLVLSVGSLSLALLCLLVSTYKTTKHYPILLYLYSLLVLTLLSLFTLWFGVELGYHLGILILVLIIFYKTGNKKYVKLDYFWSVMLVLFSFATWFLVISYGNKLPVSKIDLFWLSFAYFCWGGISVIKVAWFYHYKFTKNEEDLIQYNQQLELLSKTDTLTKLVNRRGFFDYIDTLDLKSYDLFFVMCDIDYFKKVNDNYGHDIGDVVLKRVSSVLTTNITTPAKVCRWGGEEFLIVIPDKTQKQVVDLLESLRMQVARESFNITEEKSFFVTMTFGVSEFKIDRETVEDCIKRADENLYIGKQRDRNRVVY